MINVMTIFGTRPEAIKMAPLVRALEHCPDITARCCVTGQHRQMLDSVLTQFQIRPDHDLDIMSPSQTLADITSRTLQGLDKLFAQTKPDLVLVHGDTSTAFAAALAAFYHKIAIGHVEAGLRTGDPYSPFPEEMNRKMISSLATLHFCPTGLNRENLARENVVDGVFVTGNTVIDALKLTIKDNYTFENPKLAALDTNKRLILATCHRRENYGQPMTDILGAFRDVLEACPDVELVLPVHMSPVVSRTVQDALGKVPRVHLVEPLQVSDMHNLMARCTLVMTDSGGLQEEAPALGKPVLVLRRETERPEAVTAGTVSLCGVERAAIRDAAIELLTNKDAYARMAQAVNPYGDGQAGKRIIDAVRWRFGVLPTRPANFSVE